MTDCSTDKAIENLIKKIRTNPLMICRERDLQGFLFKELIECYPKYCETRKKDINNKPYQTQRVHLEYPSHGHNFDVIVFEEQDIQNINSSQGLYVYYQNSKGETGSNASKYKRSVLSTALIEIKKPEGESITLEKIKDDFDFLRSWKEEYEFFNNNPELFFVCYHFWEPTPKKAADSQIEIYQEAIMLAEEEPIINFYLLLGPSNFWENYLGRSLHSKIFLV